MQRQGDWLDRALIFGAWFLGTFTFLTFAWALTESFTPIRLNLGGSRIALLKAQAVFSLAMGIWRSWRVSSSVATPGSPVAGTRPPHASAFHTRGPGPSTAPAAEPASSAPRPGADSRAMAEAMVAGMVAQVSHEAELHDGTWPEPLALRLVAQVPIRDQQSPRSWLGGRPRMPAAMPWPEVEGTPCDFFAQIALADLPAELWHGQGPRQGWLALFLHPTRYAERLIHIPELGPVRDVPNPLAEKDGWYNPYGWHYTDALQQRYMHRTLPEWPVDVLAFGPTETAPEGNTGNANAALYSNGFDLSDPAHHPFDWPGMLALVDSALAALESHYGKEFPSPNQLELQLAGLEERLAAGEPGAEAGKPAEPYTPAQIAEIEHRARALRELIPASAKAGTLGRAALDAVRQIAAEVHADAAIQPFIPERAQQLLARLKTISWMKVLRRRDPLGRAGAELIETMLLPITVHHRDASLFAWDYHLLHFDIARHAYCRDIASLPAAVRALYEPLWLNLGTKSAPQLGGFPRAYVHAFSPDVDLVVLDLPSNQLMGWQFGDVDSVVLTMRLEEMSAASFPEARLQVSN